MACRSSGMPGPGGYWLPVPARTASAAICAIARGPSTSGKPWPRLTEPVASARADISAKIVVPSPSRRRLSKGRFTLPCNHANAAGRRPPRVLAPPSARSPRVLACAIGPAMSAPIAQTSTLEAAGTAGRRRGLSWEHADCVVSDTGKPRYFGESDAGARGAEGGRRQRRRACRVSGGDDGALRIGFAGGGGAGGRAVLLGGERGMRR